VGTNKPCFLSGSIINSVLSHYCFSEILPDSGDPDSETGKLILKMKKMLSEAEPATHKQQPPNYDLVPGKVTLRALGIGLGERVIVGGAKVSE
jgi:hypothetical protein